ncbi:hypothetical protein HMPREF1531_00806 [Propionibacterium sp. oral taxon 192 str. F0372]|uniref:molybdopterin-containing oxidoreductase family protein n=1 Tax=Propionibacterium sp. oral taxon 192 TaxID=671222 RepID=UPI0003532D73|nr:molybdopterin-dependent oxidoreductase [Propionibacterium sp. oral taxon 192]EPH06157.1 hypothetical protein HMPREF1531_00806 [Propionibacterium sp. oral taxon 192 str. F0372]
MCEDAIRSICRSCHGGCGVLLRRDDADERVWVQGDPSNPNNHGFLCAKGRAASALARHPDRLTRPLRRIGPRGEGFFEEIEWDQALSIVTERIRDDVATAGPRSVVLAQGTDRNYQEWVFRFANSLGTPNVMGPADICFYPRVMAGILTMGGFTFVDYEGKPEVVLLWGSNKPMTNSDGVIGIRLLDAIAGGTQLVVVDPVETSVARRARVHLQLRPGTDAALGLGLIHQVFELGLIDADFIANHTTDAELLREHTRGWTLDRTADVCGLEAEDIFEAVRLYGGAASAGIEMGTGAQQSRDSFSSARLLVMLSGLCGNIDVPGGDVLWDPPGIVGRRTMPGSQLLPGGAEKDRLVGSHQILGMSGWAHSSTVFEAILSGKPYTPRSLLVFGSNLLVSYANSMQVERALRKVGFVMVADMFLTPTAYYADVVLPVPSWVERDQIVEHANYVAARNAVLSPMGESRSDEEIITELAMRLGLKGFWESPSQSLDARLAPVGRNWMRLQRDQYWANSLRYCKYETEGFPTHDGRFHFAPSILKKWGFPSLPEFSDPGSFNPSAPLILTSRHSPFYFNSEFRNVEALRDKQPYPIVEVSRQVAADRGLASGEWAVIERNGEVAFFKVRVSDRIRSDTVCASASWWYPEMGTPESWQLSNINALTDDCWSSPEMGSANLRGCRCDVRTLTPSERERIRAAFEATPPNVGDDDRRARIRTRRRVVPP